MNEHYILDVASQKGKIDWPGAIQRSGAFPLDRSSVFSSLADAEVYIQGLPNDSRGLGATSYAGQFISVYDDTTKQVYPYLVQFTQNADGSLKKVLTRVLLTGDAVSGGSTTGTGTGSSLDDVSWILIDGGSADDAINMLHSAVCSVRCVDQDTKEVLYTATPLSAYFTAYNIYNDNNYYINLDDISSVVKTLSWNGSDSYVFVGVDTDNTVVVNDNYVLNGSTVTYNYHSGLNTPDSPPDLDDSLGDINKDGFIDELDSQLLTDYMSNMNLDDYDSQYDLDRNGSISANDYAELRKLMAKYTTTCTVQHNIDNSIISNELTYSVPMSIDSSSIKLTSECLESLLDNSNYPDYASHEVSSMDVITPDGSIFATTDSVIAGLIVPIDSILKITYVPLDSPSGPDAGDDPPIENKSVSYTVTHCKYSEPVETNTYRATVSNNVTMVPIIPDSLTSKAGTGEFVGYTLANFIPYSTSTEIPDGTEIIIDYVLTGDVNSDGKIDTDDITALNNWVASTEDYHPIYDLNADGYINGDDFALLRGLIPDAF